MTSPVRCVSREPAESSLTNRLSISLAQTAKSREAPLACLGSRPGLRWRGPMARSARDLMTALRVLGGAVEYKRKAWSWTLPPPRKRALKEFRVGYVLDSPMASPTSEVRPLLDRTLSALERAGVQLRPGWPPGYDLREAYNNYMFLLSAFTFSTEGKQAEEIDREKYQQNPQNPFAAGSLSSYADWQQQRFRQLSFRAMWQEYFQQVDVFLMPTCFTVAFQHDHKGDFLTRTLHTPDGIRPYMQLMPWVVTATLTRLPGDGRPDRPKFVRPAGWNPDHGAILGRCNVY